MYNKVVILNTPCHKCLLECVNEDTVVITVACDLVDCVIVH